MFKYIILILILISSCWNINSIAQGTESILLPFSYKEVWNTDVINGRDDYGVHKDRLGVAMDFYTDQSSMVLAPISGTFEQGCVSQGVTLVSITNQAGLKIRLLHLLDDTLEQRSGFIKQGSPVGMTAPRGEYNSPGCNVSSDGYHVHFGIVTTNQNTCAYLIDGYNFYCQGMTYCSKSQNGSYPLSFAVDCNRKYINQKFVSTNGFPLDNSQCDALIKNANGSMPKDETNILNLQVCLTKANLYFGVYSRQYDDNTKSKVAQYLGKQSTGPSQAEIDAKLEAAKKAEEIRLAEDSKKAQEAQKAEEDRLALEYKTAKEKADQAIQIQATKDEEAKKELALKTKIKADNDKYNSNQTNIRNIILLATTMIFICVTLMLLVNNKRKK